MQGVPAGTVAQPSPIVVTIQGALGGVPVKVDGSTIIVTQSALPAGAATAAKQDTGNTTLSNISGQLPVSLGAKASASSITVTFATDLPYATSTLQGTGNSLLSTISGQLSAARGAQTAANSMSVGIASDQMSALASAALQSAGNTSLSQIASSLATGVSSNYVLTQVMAGKCFVFALPLTSVSIGNYLNVTLTNPAGSGQIFIIFDRRFSQTTGNVLLYTSYTSPTALTGATTKAGTNQWTGSANTSAVSMAYLVTSTAMSGTLIGSMPIPPNGVENAPVTIIRSLPPGSSIGYQFGGTGGVLTAASSFTITIQGCTQ